MDNKSNNIMSGGSGGGSRSPRFVDHTYRDFSRYLEHGRHLDRHKKVEANFPAKLHQMLSDPHFEHIIVWMVRPNTLNHYFMFLDTSCDRHHLNHFFAAVLSRWESVENH